MPSAKTTSRRKHSTLSGAQTIEINKQTKKNLSRLNTIPIVLGGVNYTAELPPNSFINAAQFLTPQGG